jgi:hypothetical protein
MLGAAMNYKYLKHWLPWTILAAMLALGIGYALVNRRGSDSPEDYLERKLGYVDVPGIDEAGLYRPEHDGLYPFRWTDGSAKLIVPIHRGPPQGLTVSLGLGVPSPIKLVIRANEQTLFDQAVRPQRVWKRFFVLDGVPQEKALTIEVLSSVFVPAEITPGNHDRRKLGVRLFEVFLHRQLPEFENLRLGVEPICGIEEAGFHDPETFASRRFRWTNGRARLSVPLRKAPPKVLLVELEVPRLAADRLAIIVNGRTLMDEPVRPRDDIEGAFWRNDLNWASAFLLKDVLSAEKLTIDIISGSFVPARITPGATDPRTLGVKVRGITLLD